MRKLRNTSETAPLRPDITGAAYIAPPMTRSQVQALYDEIRRLKNELAAERKRHIRLERALSRYQNILEQQIQTQQQTFEELRKAIVVTVGQNLVRGTR
jgi:exonuclease VII large subunit